MNLPLSTRDLLNRRKLQINSVKLDTELKEEGEEEEEEEEEEEKEEEEKDQDILSSHYLLHSLHFKQSKFKIKTSLSLSLSHSSIHSLSCLYRATTAF